MKKIRNDIILIVSILIIVLIFFLVFIFNQKSDNLVCEIYKDDILVNEIKLDHEEEIKIEATDGYVVILITASDVSFKESTCKDQICVHQGKINKSGQTITCLPNKIYVKLVGKGADVVVWV